MLGAETVVRDVIGGERKDSAYEAFLITRGAIHGMGRGELPSFAGTAALLAHPPGRAVLPAMSLTPVPLAMLAPIASPAPPPPPPPTVAKPRSIASEAPASAADAAGGREASALLGTCAAASVWLSLEVVGMSPPPAFGHRSPQSGPNGAGHRSAPNPTLCDLGAPM